METSWHKERSLGIMNFRKCEGNRRLPCSLNHLIPLLLCAGLVASPGEAFAEIPRGVFSLSPAGGACKSAVLSNSNVVGVSIRQSWMDLEPSEGVFNWAFLDSEVARVATAGKQISLRISSQAGKPAWVTTAITSAGGSFYTFDDNGVPTTIPVFWDPTFLAKKTAMIAAMGAHFSKNPAIKIISVSFANASSEDWNVPHTSSEVTQWLNLGYTSQKMLDAGKRVIDATMTAFPNQYVTLAVAGNGHAGATGNLDPDACYVARNAVQAARTSWPGRLIVQINSLSTFNPVAPGPDDSVWHLLWDSRPDVAGQMLLWCYGDTTYRVNGGVISNPSLVLPKAIAAGASYGMKFVEIYQTDVVNLPPAIGYAQDALTGLGGPGPSPRPPAMAAPAAPTGLQAQP